MNYWVFIPVIIMIVSYVESLSELAERETRKFRVIFWFTLLGISTICTLLMISWNLVW